MSSKEDQWTIWRLSVPRIPFVVPILFCDHDRISLKSSIYSKISHDDLPATPYSGGLQVKKER